MKIDLGITKYTYDKSKKTFYFSEKDIRFDTTYELINPKTNGSMVFKFSESTGPEFDPKTQWIYTNPTGYKMIVSNDPKITNQRAQAYIKSKTRYESSFKLSSILVEDVGSMSGVEIGNYIVKMASDGSFYINLANVNRYSPIINIRQKKFVIDLRNAVFNAKKSAVRGEGYKSYSTYYDLVYDPKIKKLVISDTRGKSAKFAVGDIQPLIAAISDIAKRM